MDEATWTIRLTVWGVPRTKKTSNRVVMVGKGKKRPVVLPSAAWTEWVKSAEISSGYLYDINGIWTPPWLCHFAIPLECQAIFYRDADRGDLVGYLQGLADLLEKRGVVANDKWIQSWDGSRLDKDAKNPRIELTLTPLAVYKIA